ncbi:hypothetical protein MCOR25_006377 [Pyricularia grisea]|uniref:Uncharacterized protein n=1 Tax=Pyricularia grisea TaxID=148305 RepID=A0A6P8AQC3_PYRGI|nr:uncharacterized protein PgNI_12052 [Pyricularia grisea]KAI6361811.1 hypothetical protein MCOR25_006377 [Pyricularia grisea]TLD04265.1 hypothetical protein PgNI_12052 [Pyricularia grisea]
MNLASSATFPPPLYTSMSSGNNYTTIKPVPLPSFIMKASSILILIFVGVSVAAPGTPVQGDMLEVRQQTPRPQPTASPSTCTPGKYRCSGSDIQVCNSSKQWILSAKCSPKKCSEQNGGAYCI